MLRNLIKQAWIPVLRKSGVPGIIAPWQLTETDDPVIALNSPRPDFNGALMQFLIGLLQTAATPADQHRWLDWLEETPSPEKLKESLSAISYAFELDDEKGSFMQDFETLDEGTLNSIAELLIDSPGGNTVKENKDHFVKRGRIGRVCQSCAATALFTLQINAPAGGQGHRTSLRGGGPLTTLVIPDENSDLPNDLWRTLWMNVLDKKQVDSLTGDKHKTDPSDIFPWLANSRTSENSTGSDTTPLDVNPMQMYWGMPRRLKIQWGTVQVGSCDICNTSSNKLVSYYKTKNYGINYKGAWQHPLSPYSLNKTGELLPQHPQPGGLTYQHWLGLFEDGETRFSASIVKNYRKLLSAWGEREQLRLYVFGYDMDNMKARCWYETTYPLFTIPEDIRLGYTKRIQVLTESASEFAGFVRTCVKDAWFKRPGDAKGDVSFLINSFYQSTEAAFYQLAKELQAKLANGTDREILHSWHQILGKSALELFDYWAACGDITQLDPRRIALARSKLMALFYSKKIREALQLPDKNKEAA